MNFKKLEFCHFGFGKITTDLNKDGEEKKKLIYLPDKALRNKITPATSYFGKFSTAIITGKQSNITVIDCDTTDSYNNLVKEYPSFKNYYTVKTNKGYHIYCKYCQDVKTSTDTDSKIDIRNDGGIIIAPPTKYKLLDGSTAEYKYIGGNELGIFPQYLIDRINNNTNISNISKVSKSKIISTKQQPINKTDKLVIEYDNTPNTTINDNNIILQFLQLLSKKRVDNRDKWIKLG